MYKLSGLARRLGYQILHSNGHQIRCIFSITNCSGGKGLGRSKCVGKDVCRWMASASNKRKDVVAAKTKNTHQVQLGQKVAQASKDVTYIAVVVVGAVLLVAMFYTVGQELMDSKSPNSVFTRSLKLCKKNYEVMEAIGEPIKGYGEMDRRGRRKHVSHVIYTKNGSQYMRMKFYIEGSKRKGTVHLQVEQVSNGNLEYNYMYIDLDGYPQQRIIIESQNQA
ncbi:mitochondrial import inner membrane translocase subunit Tim21-like [Anneissia japonica]|uniref:mitochondrial import inner membrane translocase subunit Tim21-like n=1 Tax=Anneissia japonica TaxID=1529436 RepID=UPI001425B206|nr:mitochondrial import inner membrane translocase subunit Tim21-like [Anneissia japonica]XP_033125241.1 mitochondrial import inner membrane translocase subunit Tim21-like [Anneissia japonica]XP_033125242.1 mitochondrial import inner membrane translocase subunit Tim21-like [Anneissia japonica]XP_033125244.1 mitochondrial import inner membrane translocase subunit Tim21-like [Anneissia japonica]